MDGSQNSVQKNLQATVTEHIVNLTQQLNCHEHL